MVNLIATYGFENNFSAGRVKPNKAQILPFFQFVDPARS
jgi:hypothetical protein